MSISIGNLVLTRFGSLHRPYLILMSGNQLTAAALSSCSREKNTINRKHDVKSTMVTHHADGFRCASTSSQKLGKLAFNVFTPETTRFCIVHVIMYKNSLRTSFQKIKISNYVASRCIHKKCQLCMYIKAGPVTVFQRYLYRCIPITEFQYRFTYIIGR
jgi:hypothetical protein